MGIFAKRDLQPWLDYFDMLQSYQYSGHLEVFPDKREAYITLPALCALSNQDDPFHKAILDTVRRIRVYAGWKSQEGEKFLDENFAVNVVSDQPPHDMLYTVLLSRRRTLPRLWRKGDSVDVIDYTEKKKP